MVKDAYNGLGQLIAEYETDGAGGTSYSAASSVSSDTVLTQTEYGYDADGNVIETTTSDRLSTASGTGPLAPASGGASAQVDYSGSYFDAANRLIDAVDMGNNGGSPWTNTGTIPTRSSTVLLTTYGYDSAGNVEDVTDPNGIDTHSEFDAGAKARSH